MKKIYLTLVLFVSVLTNATAQNVLQRTFMGDMIYENDVVWSESDQTYVMASYSYSGQLFVTKTTSTGYPVWNMEYVITGGFVNGKPDVVVTTTGDIFICGYFTDQMSSGVMYYLMAVHPWGSSFWCKTYATQSLMGYTNPSLTILPDGNFMITESVYGHVGFIKVSPAGNLISSNMYREDPGSEAKTPGFASDIFPDGSMVFTGKRNCDIMIVKTDANGQMQWSRVMNAVEPPPGDTTMMVSYYHTKDVIALDDGSSLACGYDNGSGFLMRLNAMGAIVWYKRLTLDPLSWSGSCFYEMKQIDANNFVVAGADSTCFLAKFDINGNILATVQAVLPGYYLGGTNVCLNSNGQIAWPLALSDNNAILNGACLMLMDDISSNGCYLNPIALSWESAATVVAPFPNNVMIFQLSQSITAATASVTDVVNYLTYGDLCSTVGTQEELPIDNSLTIRNTLLDQSTPLYFSLGNFTGEIVYTVTDMNGRIVYTSTEEVVAEEVVGTQTGLFSAGMYVLTVEAGDKLYAEKFVVRE